MITVNIRKQGSSAVMTLPPDVLKIMGTEVGDAVVLDVKKGQLTVKPAEKTVRKRYKLSELLKGVTQEKMDALINDTSWAQEGSPVGQEIG